MSLKTFHLIFITIAVLLCFGLGGWMLRAYSEFGMKADRTYGVVSICIGVAWLSTESSSSRS